MELDSKASIAIESPPPPPPPPPKKSSPPRTLPLQPPLLTQSTSMVSSILPIQSSGIYINDHSFYNLAYGVWTFPSKPLSFYGDDDDDDYVTRWYRCVIFVCDVVLKEFYRIWMMSFIVFKFCLLLKIGWYLFWI